MGHHAHHSNHLFLILCGALVACAIGLRGYLRRQMSKAWGISPRQQEGDVMLFRKPPALQQRHFTLFWLVTVVCGGIAVVQFLQDDIRFYVTIVVGLGMSAISLYLSGPDDIRLDGKQRIYERRVGWPWKPKTHFGSFNGIKGVCISPRNAVWLLLEKPDFVKSTNGIALSYFGPSPSARALADELNQTYGFPILPYPKNGL